MSLKIVKTKSKKISFPVIEKGVPIKKHNANLAYLRLELAGAIMDQILRGE